MNAILENKHLYISSHSNAVVRGKEHDPLLFPGRCFPGLHHSFYGFAEVQEILKR